MLPHRAGVDVAGAYVGQFSHALTRTNVKATPGVVLDLARGYILLGSRCRQRGTALTGILILLFAYVFHTAGGRLRSSSSSPEKGPHRARNWGTLNGLYQAQHPPRALLLLIFRLSASWDPPTGGASGASISIFSSRYRKNRTIRCLRFFAVLYMRSRAILLLRIVVHAWLKASRARRLRPVGWTAAAGPWPRTVGGVCSRWPRG